MKVKIRKWNAVATWRWDIPEDDVCGICQAHFDGTCPACKYPGDDCSLLSGKCGHNFHMHCILEWIKQDSARGQCPMCRQKFEWTEPPGNTSIKSSEGQGDVDITAASLLPGGQARLIMQTPQQQEQQMRRDPTGPELEAMHTPH